MKICSSCKHEKPLEAFHKCTRRQDGVQSECKDCRALRHKATYGDRKDTFTLNKEAARRRYVAMREKKAAEQNYICPCGLPLDGKFALDHDHACCDKGAQFSCRKCDRGVLHIGCNAALGMVGDDPQRLRNLADYLETTRLGLMEKARGS